MRSSFPIRRMVIGLFCGSLLFTGCVTSPDDFNGPQITEVPLKKVSLTNINQHATTQGWAFQVDPPADTLVVDLADGEGTYTKTNGLSVIKVKLTINSLTEFNDPLSHYTDYALSSLEMNLEITPAQDQNSIHLEQHQCVTDNSMLTVLKKKRYPNSGPSEWIPYAVDATIENLVEKTDTEGNTVFEGDFHVFTFVWPEDITRDDLFIYDLRGRIRIE